MRKGDSWRTSLDGIWILCQNFIGKPASVAEGQVRRPIKSGKHSGRNDMNIKVVRMKGKGSRTSDRAATIDWKIELDKTNHRVIIKTEQATYYSKQEWLCGLKEAFLK